MLSQFGKQLPSIMGRITPKSVYYSKNEGDYYLHGYARATSEKVSIGIRAN
jgi:hypothetical protein